MKTLTVTAILILAGSSVAFTQASQVDSVEKQIRRLENELNEASKRGDVAAFQRLLAEDYTTTAMISGTRTKAQLIADIKSGAQKVVSITLEDVKIRVYGDTAILTALQTSKGQYKGRDTSGQFYRLRIYVNQQGQWRAVAFQTTPVAKG